MLLLKKSVPGIRKFIKTWEYINFTNQAFNKKESELSFFVKFENESDSDQLKRLDRFSSNLIFKFNINVDENYRK